MFLHHFFFFTNLLDNNLNAPNRAQTRRAMTQLMVGETPSDADQREWRAKANNLLSRARHSRHMSEEGEGARADA